MKNLLDWKIIVPVLVALVIWYFVSPMFMAKKTKTNGNGNGTGAATNGSSPAS